MGCDIHTYAERKVGDKYELITDRAFDDEFTNGKTCRPFTWRSYGMFAVLAGVRNYSDVPPIAQCRGFPDNASQAAKDDYESWGGDAHSPSWLAVDELAVFDYDQSVEDRRVTVRLSNNVFSGAGTAEPGGGKMTTYREFLGEAFFRDLAKLREIGADRVVFFFDN